MYNFQHLVVLAKNSWANRTWVPGPSPLTDHPQTYMIYTSLSLAPKFYFVPCCMVWLLYSICICLWDTEWWLGNSCQEQCVLTNYIFQTKHPNPSGSVAKPVFQAFLHHLTEEVRISPTVDGGQQRKLRLRLQFCVTLGHWERIQVTLPVP